MQHSLTDTPTTKVRWVFMYYSISKYTAYKTN